MANNGDMLKTSDQRNCDRLHQQRRYAVRITKTRKQTLLNHSPRPTNQIRLPARSWKRNDLTILQDEDEDLLARIAVDALDSSDDDPCDYLHDNFGELTRFTTNRATNHYDAQFLYTLRKELNQHLGQRRRMLYTRDQTKIRRPHTILTYVIDRGDSEGIQIVLENIFCGYIYPTMIDHVCSNGKTALWYACNKGNFDLVQELVKRGHASINKCGILIVAAQNGHEKIVDYLLSRGCDPNRRAKNYNERALHAASRRNHLGIVNALLKHGADPTILDYKKRTALDYAIHKRHIEIAKVLIYYHGGRFAMTQTGFTPLMLAASRNNKPIIDILLNILPYQQVLDELTLLACNYTISGITSKRDQAYCYFEKALSMTTPLCKSTPCEAYEFINECQTLDELAIIRKNDNAMRMHALLVSERLLLKSGEVSHLVSLIMKQSNIYKLHGEFHRCLQLQLHAYQLIIQTEHNVRHNVMLYENCLYALVNVLLIILYENDTVPVESLTLVWTWILNRASKSLTTILFTLLCATTYLMKSKSLTGNEQRILSGLVLRTVRQRFVMPNGYFFFSYCLNAIATSVACSFTFNRFSVPALSVVQLLIQCGADVDEAHFKSKSTPLHLISQGHYPCEDNARSVIRLLLNANAHTDCIDREGRLPEDCTRSAEIKELLRTNHKLSLKCRCANIINLKNVCYQNYLSSNLIAFVRMHTKD